MLEALTKIVKYYTMYFTGNGNFVDGQTLSFEYNVYNFLFWTNITKKNKKLISTYTNEQREKNMNYTNSLKQIQIK